MQLIYMKKQVLVNLFSGKKTTGWLHIPGNGSPMCMNAAGLGKKGAKRGGAKRKKPTALGWFSGR